jgi:O-antigen/teichoic acid export membrane protein
MVKARPGMAALPRAALLVGASKLLGGVTLVGLNVWIARTLPPAEYGMFAFGVSTILLLDGALGAAIDLAVLKSAAASAEPASYERGGLVLKALALGAAGVVAAIAGDAFGWLAFDAPGGRALFLLTVTAAGGLLLLRSAQTHCQLTAAFGRFGTFDVAHTSLRVALVCAVIGLGVASPIVVIACYAAAAVAAGAVAVARTIGAPSASALADTARLGELWRFVRMAGATFAVGAVVGRLDLLALAVAGTPHDLGVYSAALALATVPELLGTYLAPAFTPRAVAYRDDVRFEGMFKRTQGALIAVAACVLAAGWLFAGPLVSTALPESYAGSIPLLPVLLVAGLAAFVTFPLALNFVMCASPRTFLLMDGLTAPALLAAYLVAAKFSGAFGVACVTAASRAGKATYIQAVAARLAAGSPAGGVAVPPLAASVR